MKQTYEQWEAEVDDRFTTLGRSRLDLPEQPWQQWYHEGLNPTEAAVRAFTRAGQVEIDEHGVSKLAGVGTSRDRTFSLKCGYGQHAVAALSLPDETGGRFIEVMGCDNASLEDQLAGMASLLYAVDNAMKGVLAKMAAQGKLPDRYSDYPRD